MSENLRCPLRNWVLFHGKKFSSIQITPSKVLYRDSSQILGHYISPSFSCPWTGNTKWSNCQVHGVVHQPLVSQASASWDAWFARALITPQLYQGVSKLTGLEKMHTDSDSRNVIILLDTTVLYLMTTYIWYVLTMSDLYNKGMFLRHRHSNTLTIAMMTLKVQWLTKFGNNSKAEGKKPTSFPIWH